MFWNRFKTVIFLTTLSALLLVAGQAIGGTTGLHFAVIFALVMNFGSYFFADKIVLKMYSAQPLDEHKYKYVHEMVEELCDRANLPKPKLWLIPSNIANAFATGRNPKHSSVAVTEGILNMLDESELQGVLAHELSHVKNRDILISTIAATIAMAIGYIASMLRWSLIFGGKNRNSNGIGAIATIILMPIAATLIQFAISRSREFMADETGAKISQNPLGLASALRKISDGPKVQPSSQAMMATENMFIINPFSKKGFIKLFSTHPPTEDRIARLEKMVHQL
ncbi:zinc metalloprotease HtpX [Candidatus Babeliales bacterium]|nr:zinc metalloprotease HtpX [Candidatus Babeliales bacterium]